MRIALGLEYDGTNFFGWQAQKNNRSVQSVLEDSISLVADRRVKVSGSGRTDTGVHSIGQVVHFDTDSIRTNRGWRLGINSNLPEDISVLWVREIDNDFDSTSVVGIQMLGLDTKDDGIKMLKNKNILYPSVADEKDEIVLDLNITAFPTSILFNEKGKEIKRWIGIINEEDVEKQLQEIRKD